mmetsp:Transcript_4016/g.7712  ORF Transcript_4016/g.7712 Transcript_4016/m.7712 type:complete len:1043 (-) Transcript_4016:861-3989(-)|eukprot:CAMPEP_0176481330 /NCGR_PEP_ID=MMETSP0200_2-20121128/2760_1 /TAXON_ID=947934 /ORGANISM="Chaetoceros sp., Strain GSL56" /LENGTH=1042 /DNA_ID=CAMNT_0017877523 /DNA_START=86 /DNA_END=3217 /DNA_ORIENTATION=+
MPLKFRSRSRALKASADGNFDEHIYFDQPNGFSSLQVEESPNVSPTSLGGKVDSSSRLHTPGPLKNKLFNDEGRGGPKPNNLTFDTSLESSSPYSPFAMKTPNDRTHNDRVGKRGKFNFMKLRRKNGRKETLNLMHREESPKQKGMRLLQDDVDQDLDNENLFRNQSGTCLNEEHDPSWVATDYGSSEKGLQINFSASPMQTNGITSNSFVESSPFSVDDDGFFTNAALDFQNAFDRSTKFSPIKSNAKFDSFEAANDWDLSRGSFDSSSGEAREEAVQQKHSQSFDEDVMSPPSSSLSPSRHEPNESANDDSKYIGPIDSDTLEKWESADDAGKVLQHVPTVKRNISQLWSLQTPDRNVRNQGESTREDIKLSVDSDGLNDIATTPIDVDTLEPWTPTSHHVKPITTEPLFKDEASVADDHSQYQNGNHIQNEEQPSLKVETAPLTLGMLAQISGLVDYIDTNNIGQYGQAATDHDDTHDDEEYATEIADATKKTLEEHEKAGLNPIASEFHITTSPKVENEYGYEIDNISSFSSFQSNSPFKTNLSGIHNQSTHHFDNDVPDDFTPPKDLTDGLDHGFNDNELIEAEQEMSQILAKFNIDESKNMKSDQKEESNDNYVSNVRIFWNQKDTRSPTNKFKITHFVEWPSPSTTDSGLTQDQETLNDEFFSRNKTTKSVNVPTRVTAKPNTEMSFATELSSLCEQSYDLTEDGFQVPKRAAAKDVYRATQTSNPSHSSKGFFWRSHPDGPSSVSNSESNKNNHRIDPKADEPEIKTTAVDMYLKRVKSKRNDPLFEPGKARDRVSTSPELKNLSGKVRNSSFRNVHAPKPKDQPTGVVETKNKQSINKTSNPNPSQESKHRPETIIIEKNNVQEKSNKTSSPSMEWKKVIETKIKSTSEKIKAARHQAKSPTFEATNNQSKTIQTSSKRAPSPFQANKNSFLNKWQAQSTSTTTMPSSTSSNHLVQQKDDISTRNGIPFVIEKRSVDDDAISGCSSSIADRIKHFESKSQSNKPEISGRSTPLNSFSLSKLRSMTNNVGGLWS